MSGIFHDWISLALQPVILQPGWDIQPGAGVISPVTGVTFMHPDRKPPQKSTFSFAWKPNLFQCRSPLLTQACILRTKKHLYCLGVWWLPLAFAVTAMVQPLQAFVLNHHLSTSHYWQEKQSLLTCSLYTRKTAKIITCHWKQNPPFWESKGKKAGTLATVLSVVPLKKKKREIKWRQKSLYPKTVARNEQLLLHPSLNVCEAKLDLVFCKVF